jgi:hypothetical protein
MMDRWEILLSPGTRSSIRMGRHLLTLNSDMLRRSGAF